MFNWYLWGVCRHLPQLLPCCLLSQPAKPMSQLMKMACDQLKRSLDRNIFGHLLVQLHEVVLDSEVEQALGGVLVQLVVPVHVPRQPRQCRDLLLGPHSLRKG